MRVKVVFDFDDDDRAAIAAQLGLSKPADREQLAVFMRSIIRERVVDLVFTRAFKDAAQIDAFEPELNPGGG